MPETTRAKHIMLVTTTALSYNLLRGQVTFHRAHGHHITFISAPGPQHASASEEGAVVVSVPMVRDISPLRDLASLVRLWRQMRRLKPDLVFANTPKAGLLGSVAAALAGVPMRIYGMCGLRFETTSGWKRWLLVHTERVACHAATSVVCVSRSLRERALSERLSPPDKLVLLGEGTSNGVNLERFRPLLTEDERVSVRKEFGLGQDDFVVGFVGRFVRDKGIGELIAAFRNLDPSLRARLVLIGDGDEGSRDALSSSFRATLAAMENVVVLPWVNEPATLYRAMDVLVLPTYREGFPNVVLEAQASGVPVITTDATGAVDSVIDQETGIIVPVGNVDRLAAALQELARDPVKAATMGAAGRKRVERVFSQEKVWTEIGNFFACQIDRSSRQIGWRALVKSVADRVFSLMLLLLLSPVLLIVGLMVRVALGSPAVFVQERLGYRGKLIRVHKFRTMSDQRDRSGNLLPDAERLGTLGRLLRALSLDELPQLWDVVRGDLSFIGPRPLLVRYRERYSPEQWRRHNVKPGISGWAQVNGRNAITWEQKFALDVWYVDHWSLWLDLRILLMTLVKTVRREGISFGGDATMPEFNPSARSSAQGE